MTDLYRRDDRDPCVCPACLGMSGFIEEHQGDFEIVRIIHGCSLCQSQGVIDRETARAWWRSRPPTV